MEKIIKLLKLLNSKLNKLFSLFTYKRSLILLLVWIILLSVLYSTLSIIRHNHFESGAFDLGIFDQVVYLYSRFEIPYSTIKERFILGDHLTLTMPFLAPLYYFWDNVRALLVFQAFFVVLSSIPIFLTAKLRRIDPFASLVFAVIYSLFFGFQYLVYFDFHSIAVGVGLLAWLIFAYESKRKYLFFILLIAMLSTQENMGLGLASIGMVYIFSKKRRRDGFLFIVGGIIASLIAVQITKSFSPVGYEYSPAFSTNPIVIVERFFDHIDKRLTWLYSFSWYSFLPLFHPGAVLGFMFDVSQYFQPDKQYPHMITPYFHHRAILGVILALGTLDVLIFLKNRKINLNYVLIIMFFVVVFFQFNFHFALNKLSKPIYLANQPWMDDASYIIGKVPKDVPVVAQQNLVPHLSHRKEVYLAWPRKSSEKLKCLDQKECWWLDFAGKPEYLITETHDGATITQLLESRENFLEAIENMKKAGKITLKESKNDSSIYIINYDVD